MVCTARAVAQGNTDAPTFDDPVAFTLLPPEAQAQVERFRTRKPTGLRERLQHAFLDTRAKMMVARTVTIDDAIRAARSPQLVLLGAGLDGRAYRMPELAETRVFEVDHPDSQRDKRQRAESLTPLAREVRFVPVDFARDDLAVALAAAGHDPQSPTTWVWEGVVMYLERHEIEATLRVVAQRSAAGSRLIIAYFSPAPVLHLVGFFVRRLGEPLKSVFTAESMRTLLEAHGFSQIVDRDLPSLARAISPSVARAAERLRHLRIVTADRPG